MKQNTITKEYLYAKDMGIRALWETLEIIDKETDPNCEMVADRSFIVGKLQLINELMEYLDETTQE